MIFYRVLIQYIRIKLRKDHAYAHEVFCLFGRLNLDVDPNNNIKTLYK